MTTTLKPGDIHPQLAKQLLAIRDELVKGDIDEAFHILYQIASPDMDKYEPWEELEKRAALDLITPPQDGAEQGGKRITLCGSTRFKKEFESINKQLTLEGHIVYTVAFFGHADNIKLTDAEKERLDMVHKLKIDNSDGIFVVDVDGYIGASTRSEIEYAENTGKFVKYLSTFPDLKTIAYQSALCNTAASQTAALRARVDELEADNNRIRELIKEGTQVVLDADELVTKVTAENERLRGAIEWALGYTDFPARKEGDPPYYWRKKLRELSGIENTPDILNRLNPTQ